MLLLAAIAWIVARRLLAHLHGVTRLGLHGLERLAAPGSLLIALAAAAAGWLPFRRFDLPLIESSLEILAVAGGYWMLARLLDVAWMSARRSARLRASPGAVAALLAARWLGKIAVFVLAAVALAIRLGVTEQLYIALGAIGAALAFAARDPIRDLLAFGAMLLDPPFHIGDRVRIVDFRGGEACVGEVVRIAPTSTVVRTGQRTLVTIANARVLDLRVENLSAADRRRLELAVPVAPEIGAEELRAACAAVESDLRDNSWVAGGRKPHVWIGGLGDGLQLKVSVWLRRAADRREAQRELLLAIRARLPARRSDRG